MHLVLTVQKVTRILHYVLTASSWHVTNLQGNGSNVQYLQKSQEQSIQTELKNFVTIIDFQSTCT